jgi:hypothetical protein
MNLRNSPVRAPQLPPATVLDNYVDMLLHTILVQGSAMTEVAKSVIYSEIKHIQELIKYSEAIK